MAHFNCFVYQFQGYVARPIEFFLSLVEIELYRTILLVVFKEIIYSHRVLHEHNIIQGSVNIIFRTSYCEHHSMNIIL